jgi:hypothetical protein
MRSIHIISKLWWEKSLQQKQFFLAILVYSRTNNKVDSTKQFSFTSFEVTRRSEPWSGTRPEWQHAN